MWFPESDDREIMTACLHNPIKYKLVRPNTKHKLIKNHNRKQNMQPLATLFSPQKKSYISFAEAITIKNAAPTTKIINQKTFKNENEKDL